MQKLLTDRQTNNHDFNHKYLEEAKGFVDKSIYPLWRTHLEKIEPQLEI